MSRKLHPREISICEILRHFGESQNVCAVDTESSKTNGLRGISLDNGNVNTYLPVSHPDIPNVAGTEKEYLRNYLSNVDALIFHNSGYDIADVLIPNGFLDQWPKKFYDTMNMAHWINENRVDYSLDSVSKSLGIHGKKSSDAFKTIVGMDGDGWDDVPFDMMFEYSANDAEITHDSWERMIPEFITQGFAGELWSHEMQFIEAMHNMKRIGIRIDTERCMREILKGRQIMEECKEKLGLTWRDNVGPKVLSKMFFEMLKLPVVKYTDTGRPSFDKEAMEKYDEMLEISNNPIARVILRYRGWQKTVSANYMAYLKHCDGNSVIHPGYKLHGTVTGRISCADPALQQIPRESENEWNKDVKKAFVERDDWSLWEPDFSQLEFRLSAAYSEDQNLIDIFNSDKDYFDELSDRMGHPRQKIKTFSYATNYDAQAPKISKILGISLQEAKNLFSDFQANFPGLVQVRSDARRLAEYRGYVKYWTGRRRHFEFPRQEGRKGFNAIIQGGGAEIVKRAINRIDREVCDDNCHLILQVHDSIVPEIRKGYENNYLPKIKEIMEDVQYPFGVKFKVDVRAWPKADDGRKQ